MLGKFSLSWASAFGMPTKERFEKSRPVAPKKVSCEVCRKQLPATDGIRHEVSDYVMWFCGMDCYKTWRRR